MRTAFWSTTLKGMCVTIVVLMIVGLWWAVWRHTYVEQTSFQAAYLTELSGYQGKERIPLQDTDDVRQMIYFTKLIVGDSEYPEDHILEWLTLLGSVSNYDPGSYIIQLTQDYPGAIQQALNGEITSAQKLQAKWYRTRHFKFFPYGMTLMLLFLSGTVITLILAVERCINRQ